MRRFLAASLAAASVLACDPAAPDVPDGRHCQNDQLFPVATDLRIDLLFVVDESPEMAPYQEQLTANLRVFGSVLKTIQGGLPEVHIGVVSADPAHAGQLVARTGCGLRSGNFIIDELDATGHARTRNYDGDLEDVLACLGTLGASGRAASAPLASMRAALDPTNHDNTGFHRPGAALFVGFIGGQDDCSGPTSPGDPLACAHEGVTCDGGAPGAPGSYASCVAASGAHVDAIAPYVTFLRGLEADPNLIMVGVAAGPAMPFVVGEGPALATSCAPGTHAGALPAVRLAAFASQFPGATISSICSFDWSAILSQVAESLATTLGISCLDALQATDLRPDLPGLQPECAVSDVRYPGTEQESREVLPRCAMIDDSTPDPAGTRPCWWVHGDAACATFTSGFRIDVERMPGSSIPLGTYLEAECLSCDPSSP